MKKYRYEIEIIHEPSGAYLNYEVISEEEDLDHYKDFIRDISVIVTDVEEFEEEEDDLESIDITA